MPDDSHSDRVRPPADPMIEVLRASNWRPRWPFRCGCSGRGLCPGHRRAHDQDAADEARDRAAR